MSAAATIVEPMKGIKPVDAFCALRSLPRCVWLDSAMTEPHGRFSILAADPIAMIRADPFASLEKWFGKAQPAAPLPIPFSGGAAIGFLGYELKNQLEELPQKAVDDTGLPQSWWGIYDVLLVFDHTTKQGLLVSTGLTAEGKKENARAEKRAGQFIEKLNAQAGTPVLPIFSEPRSNFTREKYLAAVQRAKDYIEAGDVYQINLSQRFECRAQHPLSVNEQTALYLKLRETNPAPFAAFLDIGEAAILSSSPECFLEINDRTVRTFPIKGTRPRGATPAEDARLVEELRRSKKDNAELVMIVDLERNDLGRVCEFGSVHAPEIARIESYATVHHLVATVEGKLRDGISHLDCIRACFPGGSITGTPKIRAMEIIDELEPHARGVYTGAIGILGLPDAGGRQQTTLNIAIRTMTVKGERVMFHSGGGIVADSEPAAEYEETLHKARGMMEALRSEFCVCGSDF